MANNKSNNMAVNEFNQYIKPVSLWNDAWRRLKKNKMAMIGLWVVGIYLIVTFGAALLPFKSYTEQEMLHVNLPPSFSKAGVVAMQQLEKRKAELEFAINHNGKTNLVTDLEKIKEDIVYLRADIETNPKHQKVYILGTDYLGRDMLSRTIYGGQISIAIGIIGTLTAALIGIVLGALGGFLGGWVDNVIGRFVDIMYSLPYMLVVIIIMSMLPVGSNSIFVLYIAIALISWLTISRVVRGQIISLKNSEFVEAARSMGASNGRIIFRHLLPNSLTMIIIYSTLQFPTFIMNEAFLSFLGLGVSAPMASWGTLVNDGVQGMQLYPWRLLVPGLAMTIFLFAFNFLGDGLRDALDPQSKNRT